MGSNNPIVYELGLVIVAVVAFWIWQTVSLRRDAKALREKAQREASGGPGDGRQEPDGT